MRYFERGASEHTLFEDDRTIEKVRNSGHRRVYAETRVSNSYSLLVYLHYNPPLPLEVRLQKCRQFRKISRNPLFFSAFRKRYPTNYQPRMSAKARYTRFRWKEHFEEESYVTVKTRGWKKEGGRQRRSVVLSQELRMRVILVEWRNHCN